MTKSDRFELRISSALKEQLIAKAATQNLSTAAYITSLIATIRFIKPQSDNTYQCYDEFAS